MFIFMYLFLTIAIEGTLLLFITGGWHAQTQLVFLLANLFSWSILHFLWLTYEINIWVLECGVTIFEAIALLLVAKISSGNAFKFSFATNTASLGIGILMHGIP